ncbi:penicillin-binding protein 1B, partial [Salmonella enterica]|nr:penicillin-binding protein 1B [Salmonella enterica]
TPDKKDPRKKIKSNKKIPQLILASMLVCIAMGIVWIYYLIKDIDQQIESHMHTGIWEMPAKIYSRSWVFSRGESVNIEYLRSVLETSRYHLSSSLKKTGDYALSNSEILIYKRGFVYPNHVSTPKKIRVKFSGEVISSITEIEEGISISSIEIEPTFVSMLYSSDEENRIFQRLDSFPKSFIKMLVATEDRQYWSHYGINPIAIFRAFIQNILAGKTVQGGSTLTQQVVKNMFLTRERTYTRKIKEIVMSIIFDFKFSKRKILEIYLNEVYLGQDGSHGIYGFPLASTYYFGRPINELNISQQAMLIGMAKGASLYNPWTNPKSTRVRRNQVLQAAFNTKTITSDSYHQAIHSNISVLEKGTVFIQYPALINRLKKEIINNKSIDVSELSGSKIFSSFDPLAQKSAELAVTRTMMKISNRSSKKNLQAALIVIESKTGNIRAIVGDRDVKYNGFDRASDSKRQIGSLVKPFVYLTALQNPNLYRLNTWIEDKPVNIDLGNNKFWSPRNHNRKYSGQVMLVDALARSVNVATVNLGLAVGINSISDVIRSTGITHAKITKTPSMLLGTLDMSPLELAKGYQTIANLGRYTGSNSVEVIVNKRDKIIYQLKKTSNQTIPSQAAWLTLYAMQQSVQIGTSRRLGKEFQNLKLAGKTGTSSNNRDSWFVGIDGHNVVLAWAGLDNNQPSGLWGANGSLLITKAFFEINGASILSLSRPPDIHMNAVNTNGEYVCVKGTSSVKRYLPVWLTQGNVCDSEKQLYPVSVNKPYTPQSLDSLF